MKHSNNPFSFLSIFFFLTVIFSFISLLNAASLVPDTCNNIVHLDRNVEYDFCVKVLGSDPGSATATVAQLGAISFKLGLSKITSISSKITTLKKDPKLDPCIKDALKSCSEIYLDAQKDLQEGLKAFRSGDYSTANGRANAALIVPTACEFKFVQSPLSKEDNDFFQLAAISLDFTDLLHKFI